jgi:hypothetical protein
MSAVRDANTQFHLLGITRCTDIPQFASFGVSSFDSTSAFRQAFKDDKDNYHTVDGSYTAIRVPQVDGYSPLKAKILAGQVDQDAAIDRERACLRALQRYDTGQASSGDVVGALQSYNEILGFPDYSAAYKQVLDDLPWKDCPCDICTSAGINVLIYRGSERNKRRGFHNLFVLRQRLSGEPDARSAV